MSSGPTREPDRPRASAPWLMVACAVLVLGLLVAFPPFRVVRAGSAGGPSSIGGAAVFDPVGFAEAFWNERLLPAAGQANDLEQVLLALRSNPAQAVQRHGHRVGLGSAAYFFARGSGRVTAVERSRVLVDVNGAVVAVRSGPVFGNVVRDGAGLLDVNDVPGLAEFNAISAELNRLVEERVQPGLRGLAVGTSIRFTGPAEAPESLPGDGPLLTFVPIEVEVER